MSIGSVGTLWHTSTARIWGSLYLEAFELFSFQIYLISITRKMFCNDSRSVGHNGRKLLSNNASYCHSSYGEKVSLRFHNFLRPAHYRKRWDKRNVFGSDITNLTNNRGYYQHDSLHGEINKQSECT